MDTALKKGAKYGDDNTKNTLSRAIHKDVRYWIPFMVKCVERQLGFRLEDITFSEEKRAYSLYKNLNERDLSYSQQCEAAFELLRTDPAEITYYNYCIKKFPEEAAGIAKLAQYLHFDVSDALESILRQLSSERSHANEKDVIALRAELEEMRKELGLKSSRTIQSVDEELRQFDIQARTYKGYEYETRGEKKTAEKDDEKLKDICGDIETLDREKCMNLYSTLPDQDYTYNILTEYMVRLEERIIAIDTQRLDSICGVIEECSEERCMELQGLIEQDECFPCVKDGFLERIKNRIESIWSAEDGQIFDNILLTTDFNSPDSVKKNIEYIETSGRTENKKKYIAAIRAFNNENIKIARDYYALSQKTFLQKYWIQIAIIAIGIILGFVLTGELSNLPLPICIAGGVWLAKSHGKERKMRDLWNTMT